jgi:hypothetical protein
MIADAHGVAATILSTAGLSLLAAIFALALPPEDRRAFAAVQVVAPPELSGS